MASVIVLYNDSMGSLFMGWHPHAGLRPVYSAVLAVESSDEALAVIWERLGNNLDGDKPDGFVDRSMSVGDVVIVNGQAFTCDMIGWTAIDLSPESLTKHGGNTTEGCPIRPLNPGGCRRCDMLEAWGVA